MAADASRKERAKRILPLLDLTDLSDECDEGAIESLCEQAQTPFGSVAAICIWPKFVSCARAIAPDLPLACVINFPAGTDSMRNCIESSKKALAAGADEIDLVHDYRAFLAGDEAGTSRLVEAVKRETEKYGAILKVILETGALRLSETIRRASLAAMAGGADFIKTSTGKIEVNATLSAGEIMLDAIAQNAGEAQKAQTPQKTPETSRARIRPKIGFKAAGGIKNIEQAYSYIELGEKIMGRDYIDARTFRFGASSLLADVLAALRGTRADDSGQAY